MSPSTSGTNRMEPPRKPAIHSRRSSAMSTPLPDPEPKPFKQQPSPVPEPQTNAVNPNNVDYTVFIRLPFPRGDFQDPPQVQWDSSKDKALWKVVSAISTSKQDPDWDAISLRFDVPLPFLLQQAAWLYERHFEGMRKQMAKLSVAGAAGTGSGSASVQQSAVERDVNTPAVEIGGAETLRRPSKDLQRPPSITTQKLSARPHGENFSSPSTPKEHRPGVSRTPSAATVTQSRLSSSSARQILQAAPRAPSGATGQSSRRHELASSHEESEESALGHDGASESNSGDDAPAAHRSQLVRRPPIGKKPAMDTLSSDGDAEDDEEDDDSGGYLPFASKPTKEDLVATLRDSPNRQSTKAPHQMAHTKSKTKEPPPPSESSASSASSAQPTQSSNRPSAKTADTSNNRPGPLSPKYKAELEKLSPRYRKSGSEGSPSIGSSFSDLDDVSVTQSALEDALLSNIQQHGSVGMGMGSRMSNLRDALGRK
ncbi:hypothetical protein LTR37_012247 [Vermiconidia calcicola]|uniref:Uncharacterized protein n=1 Tax=Vermiconidia calcicola TaxID=1690605 RepID=A0ACC3MZT5_9PEZI|nr:hypothetical protein LTR37_012247 [Vermiconidia calcicola]